MKLLLDTHILIWAIINSPRLPSEARNLILNPENEIFFSSVSLWEIEIKHLAKPDSIPLTAQVTYNYCKEAGFGQLPLRANSVFVLSSLKRQIDAPVHKDPFDRMLICQAITNNMKFITHDALINEYISDNIIYV